MFLSFRLSHFIMKIKKFHEIFYRRGLEIIQNFHEIFNFYEIFKYFKVKYFKVHSYLCDNWTVSSVSSGP